MSSNPQISIPSNDFHEIGFSSPSASCFNSGLIVVSWRACFEATSITTRSPMSRAPTSRYAIVLPSRLRLIEYCSEALSLPSRSALPSARVTFTIGISNMCAPVANVPSFIVT